MLPHVETIARAIERDKRLEIGVRIHDGDGYAALGFDLAGLHAVLVSAGIAEVAAAYWAFRLEPDRPFPAYEPGALADLAGIVSGFGRPTSWVDAFAEGDRWLEVYRSLVTRRRGGLWSVGDGEILRVEFVDLWKENPTVAKIIVTGFTAATIFLGGCFAGAEMMKQLGAPQCRQQHIEHSQKLSEAILKQATLEGRFTEQHNAALRHIQESLDTGIAACGSNMEGIQIEIRDGGVTLSVKGAEVKQSIRRNQ